MGVKGLTSYIIDRNGYESITMTGLLARASSQTRARKIIVDGSSLTFYLMSCRIYGHPIDMCHGGQFLQFSFNLMTFLTYFQQMNIEIVIWFDGINEDIKDETRLEREVERRQAISTFVSAPPERRTAQAAAGTPLVAMSPFFDICEYVAKKMNVRCYRALFEADPAVAKCYFDEHALCVFGEDSDYLIFGVDYIPLKSLLWHNETGEMHCQLFTTDKTAQILGISPTVLPEFASLVGNDFVKTATLHTFHSFHTADVFNSHSVITAMAQFLKDRDFQLRIEDLVFGEEDGGESSTELFLESVARYKLSPHSQLALEEARLKKKLESFQLFDAYLNLQISPDLAEVVAFQRHSVGFPFIGSERLQQEVLQCLESARCLAYGVICQLLPTEQRPNVRITEQLIRESHLLSRLVAPLKIPGNIPDIRGQNVKTRLKIYIRAVADALHSPQERLKQVRSLKQVLNGVGPLEFQWVVSLIFAADSGALDSIARAGVPVLTLLKCFIASLVLLRNLRLQERADMTTPPLFNLHCFLFFRVAQMSWKTAGFLLDAFAQPVDLPLIDMFDGRLFHSVSQIVLLAEDSDGSLSELLGPKMMEYDTIMSAIEHNCSLKFPEAEIAHFVEQSDAEPTLLSHEGLWTKVLLNRPLEVTKAAFVNTKDPLDVISDDKLNLVESKWTNLAASSHLNSSLTDLETASDAPLPVSKPRKWRSSKYAVETETSAAQLKTLTDYVRQIQAASRPSMPFSLEPFQAEAIKCINQGHSILVCAPTGAGKTEIAMRAIERVIKQPNGRVFFISPTKALVHQIYVDVSLRFQSLSAYNASIFSLLQNSKTVSRGLDVKPALVGLITADFQIQTNARVIITVPELLRLFLHSPEENGLKDLKCVILDEFHLIQDESRGGEWERIILMLPSDVALVALSATLSKPSTFVTWANRRLLAFSNAEPLLLVQPDNFERPVPLRISKLATGGVFRSVNPILLCEKPEAKHFSDEDVAQLHTALTSLTPSSSTLSSDFSLPLVCRLCNLEFRLASELLLHLKISLHGALLSSAEMQALEGLAKSSTAISSAEISPHATPAALPELPTSAAAAMPSQEVTHLTERPEHPAAFFDTKNATMEISHDEKLAIMKATTILELEQLALDSGLAARNAADAIIKRAYSLGNGTFSAHLIELLVSSKFLHGDKLHSILTEILDVPPPCFPVSKVIEACFKRCSDENTRRKLFVAACTSRAASPNHWRAIFDIMNRDPFTSVETIGTIVSSQISGRKKSFECNLAVAWLLGLVERPQLMFYVVKSPLWLKIRNITTISPQDKGRFRKAWTKFISAFDSLVPSATPEQHANVADSSAATFSMQEEQAALAVPIKPANRVTSPVCAHDAELSAVMPSTSSVESSTFDRIPPEAMTAAPIPNDMTSLDILKSLKQVKTAPELELLVEKSSLWSILSENALVSKAVRLKKGALSARFIQLLVSKMSKPPKAILLALSPWSSPCIPIRETLLECLKYCSTSASQQDLFISASQQRAKKKPTYINELFDVILEFFDPQLAMDCVGRIVLDFLRKGDSEKTRAIFWLQTVRKYPNLLKIGVDSQIWKLVRQITAQPIEKVALRNELRSCVAALDDSVRRDVVVSTSVSSQQVLPLAPKLPVDSALDSSFDRPILSLTPESVLDAYNELPTPGQLAVQHFLETKLKLKSAQKGNVAPGRIVAKLKEKDLLPAIIFELSRKRCQQVFLSIEEPLVASDSEDFGVLKAALDEYIKLEHPAVVAMEQKNQANFLKGIGIHHSGFSRGWRTMVERMFRDRRLKCIVATATLAVGIHMPCKATVFMFDSIHLDASSFHQMSGRAGRRGYDSEGYVLFVHFSMPRIKYLVNKSATDLHPTQRLSLSAALELVDTAQRNPKQAAFTLHNTLNIHIGGPEEIRKNIQIYKFSLNLLVKFGLIKNVAGALRPTVAGSSAARTSYYDPVNIFLVALSPTDGFETLLGSLSDLVGWFALMFTFSEPYTASTNFKLHFPAKLVDLVNHMNAEIIWEAAQMLQQTLDSAGSLRTSKFDHLPFATVKNCAAKLVALAQRFSPKSENEDACLTEAIKMLSGPQPRDEIFSYSAQQFAQMLHREFGKGWEALPILLDRSPKSTKALVYFFCHARGHQPKSTDEKANQNSELVEDEEEEDLTEVLFRQTARKFDYPGSELATLVKDFCKFVEKMRSVLVAVEKSFKPGTGRYKRIREVNEACFDLATNHLKQKAGPFYPKLTLLEQLRARN